MAVEVIGREQELGAIQAFLAGVEEGPVALVLSGEPGIGKTILWDTGVGEAESCCRVLVHRSVEAEALLSFAGLSDLVAPVFEEVAPLLAPPRRRALEVALLLVEPGEEAVDARAIGLALLDVVRVVAERGPVVLALDDVQWLDPSSAGVLQVALRRLRDERAGLLATVRRAPETGVPFALERVFPGERLTSLSLGPLGGAELQRLLRERLGLELAPFELARVREATAGNPFFALELGRELVRTGTRPGPGEALPVPESLRDLLGGRLAALPGETLDVLVQVAALARPTLELVAASHGDRDGVLVAVEAAVREGVLELDGSRLGFVHPLLASICYGQAPSWKRRAVHRTLAEAVPDVEERARHLALGADGPSVTVAVELDAAAERAAGRGATAAAAELLELAGELTPPEDARTSRRRRLQAARFHVLAGNGEQARTILEQLLAEVPAGIERARVLLTLTGPWREGDLPTMIKLGEEALAEAGGDDALCAEILSDLSQNRLWQNDTRGALADARAALARARRVGDPVLLARAIARAGMTEWCAGAITPGLLEEGVAIEERLGRPLPLNESPRTTLAVFLMFGDQPDRARAIFEEVEKRAVARGDEHSHLIALNWLALLEWQAGRWQRALEHAAAASELAEQAGWEYNRRWALHHQAQVEVHLGQVEQARATAAQALAIPGSEFFRILTLGDLGHLELALGNLDAADERLRGLPAALVAAGFDAPPDSIWPDTIETLIGLGELEQAHIYLDQYQERARRLSRWATASSDRCRGLLAAAEGDLDGALEALEHACAEHEQLPYPFEHGRTLLALGQVHRQAAHKRAAREALEQALMIFEHLGARLWAEKTRAELRRISGRRPPTHELTETEQQVAQLAAEGRSNKEIAAELYMGVGTVEKHLTRVYRKLGVRSRTQLGQRVKQADAAAKTANQAAET